MYHIPEAFFEQDRQYIHVAPGTEEDIYEALCLTNHAVYYDFINFCKEFNDRGKYVVCYYSIPTKTVHIFGDANKEINGMVYELEELITDVPDYSKILQLI